MAAQTRQFTPLTVPASVQEFFFKKDPEQEQAVWAV
jgi:hypothetical protein